MRYFGKAGLFFCLTLIPAGTGSAQPAPINKDLPPGWPRPGDGIAGQDASPRRSAPTDQALIGKAITWGEHEYTKIAAPALVLIAFPYDFDRDNKSPTAKPELERRAAQAAAVEAGMTNAKVIRLPYANHYIFRSNEAEVEREMNAFMDGPH
jgi:hypothetical protein